MTSRPLSLLSTFALVPAIRVLLHQGSILGLVYLSAFFATLAYHWSGEQRFQRIDHALAYGVIAANTYMVFATKRLPLALAGCAFVLLALVAYVDARRNKLRYDRSHAAWHVLSGLAGFLFARGYS